MNVFYIEWNEICTQVFHSNSIYIYIYIYTHTHTHTHTHTLKKSYTLFDTFSFRDTSHCKMAQRTKWSNNEHQVITTGYVILNHCSTATGISSSSYSGMVFIQLQYCWAVKAVTYHRGAQNNVSNDTSPNIQAEVALKPMFMVSIRITQCPEVTALDAEHTIFIFQQTVVCNELVCSVSML